jgi:hypothetical protein
LSASLSKIAQIISCASIALSGDQGVVLGSSSAAGNVHICTTFRVFCRLLSALFCILLNNCAVSAAFESISVAVRSFCGLMSAAGE